MKKTPDFQEEVRRLDFLQRSYENALFRRSVTAINRFNAKAHQQFLKNGDIRLDELEAAHKTEIRTALFDITRKVIRVFGHATYDGLKSRHDIETKDIDDFFEQLFGKWFATEALKSATSIAQTSRKNVVKAIEDGHVASENTLRIGRRIRQVAGLTAVRARMIAVTETHNAATYASINSALDAQTRLPVKLLKFWVPVTDERTRISHAVMGSHPGIPLDEKFTVGGEKLDRPGDPNGSGANVVHCRCALVYREQEIEME